MLGGSRMGDGKRGKGTGLRGIMVLAGTTRGIEGWEVDDEVMSDGHLIPL